MTGILDGQTAPVCCPVLELRQYTMQPGRRDELIDLFEREFVETQEAAGISVVGHFRDRRRPDFFVWFRGFASMPARHAALERFYGGPVWAAHRAAANATLVDSDDVLLLTPARPETGFRLDAGARPRAGVSTRASLVLAGIHPLRRPLDPPALDRFEPQLRASLESRGARLSALMVTEPSPNTFTRLPVRDALVLVWVATTARREAPTASLGVELDRALGDAAAGAPQLLELEPAARSLLGR